MPPRVRSGVASGKKSATNHELEDEEPSRADHDEVSHPSEAVGPAGVVCWVCDRPVQNIATDYDNGGTHAHCALVGSRIERGLGGKPPLFANWWNARW